MARRAAVACEFLEFRQIGVGERIGEHRRLRRLPRPDIDIDDEAAVGLLDGNVAVQGVQRRHLLELVFIGGRRMNPDQAEQRRGGSVGGAAEFGILVDAGAVDHLQQHVVGGDQARLAFHHHREAGDVLGARRQFAIDQLQFAGVDIKLGGGRVFRCQAFADRDRGTGADQSGSRDRALSPPDHAAELQHAEAGRRSRRRWRGAGLGLAYRLVINEHEPRLPFEPPRGSAERSFPGLRQARANSARNKRNRKN